MKQRKWMVVGLLIGLGVAQTADAHGFRGGRVVVRASVFHPARAAVVVRAPVVRVRPFFHPVRTAVVVGVPLGVPLFYPPPYFPPVGVASSAPPVYIERSAVAPRETNYWHYCDIPEGYYPYVKECPAGWRKVAPQPN